MKNKILRVSVKILILAAILIPLAFLLRDSSDQLMGGYDASAPTSAKFAKLTRWLPPDADLFAVIDVHRFFSEPGLRAKVMGTLDRAGSIWGIDASLLRSLVAERGSIGLVAFAMKLGASGHGSSAVAVAQGRFDEDEMVGRIESQLAADGEKLVRDRKGEITVYAESQSGDDFAFAFPDRNHLVLGTKFEVDALTAGEARAAQTWKSVNVDAPLFGRVVVTPRTKGLLPAQLKGLTEAAFFAGSDLVVTADVACASQEEATDLVLFVEGARATLTVIEPPDSKLTKLLGGLTISGTGNRVSVRFPLNEIW
jgi:hypothetical protein